MDLLTPAAGDDTPPLGTTPIASPGLEPLFNFRSLLTGQHDEDKAHETTHIEHAAEKPQLPVSKPASLAPVATGLVEGNRSRGDSGESSVSAPPIYVEHALLPNISGENEDDQIMPAPTAPIMIHDPDKKWAADMNLLDHGHVRETTM